ncbi:MAG: hypothetical protein V2A63_04265 [Patescibacteria group bacterium]
MSEFENSLVDVWVCGDFVEKQSEPKLSNFAKIFAKNLGGEKPKKTDPNGFLVVNVRRAKIPPVVKNYLEQHCRLVLHRDIKLKVREKNKISKNSFQE